MIGNKSGLKGVVFFFFFCGDSVIRFYCDARAICGTRSQKTETVFAPIAQKRRGQLYVEVSEVYFYIYSLF